MSGITVRRAYPVLSKVDVRKIHAAAFEGLERIGVKVRSAVGRKLLADAGATVDERTEIAKIPEALTKDCLRQNPSHVPMGARNPKKDVDLDMEHVHICNDGTGTLVGDWTTGDRRPSTSEDLAASARISTVLENLHVFWPTVASQDYPEAIRDFLDLKISFMNTDKPILYASGIWPEQTRRLRAMAAAVAGGEEALRKRPILSSVHTSIAPLQHDAGNVEGGFIFGEVNVPVAIFTMPTPGASGPVTLAGSVTVAAMEFLSGLVMDRLANPKCPVIWGCGLAPLDMRTTTRGGGSPEHGLTGAAVTAVAHGFGVPALTGGFDSTSSVLNSQSAIETVISGASVVLGGADLIVGFGLVEDAKTLWLEKLFLDDEIAGMIRRIGDGIIVNDRTIALDVIEKVGPGAGKTYLGQRHTMDHLRSEIYMPKLVDRRAHDLWVADGRKTIEERAREKVRETLAKPLENPLDAMIVKELDAIIHGPEPAQSAGEKAGWARQAGVRAH